MFKDTQVDQQVAKKKASVWKQWITGSDETQRRLWEDLRDLRDVSEEASLIYLTVDISEVCKSALFEMSLRRWMRRLRDASEMHPCRLGYRSITEIICPLNIFAVKYIFVQKEEWNKVVINELKEISNVYILY